MAISLRVPQRRPSLDELLFAGLLLLYLVPVWAFRFIPTQDGPSHLDTANVMRLYSRPEGEPYRKYFDLTRDLDPYWTVDLLLKGLMDVVPPLTAEKILVTMYVLLFPLSVRYLVRSVDPRRDYLSWLAFPLMMGYWFHMGFYHYCLGLSLYCWITGLWLRQQARVTPAGLAALAALSVVLYFTHPFPGDVLVLTLIVLAGWTALREKKSVPPGTLLVFLPFLVLLGSFSLAILAHPPRPPVDAPYALSDAWTFLLSPDTLASFSRTQIPMLRIEGLLFFVLLAWAAAKKIAARRLEPGGGLLCLFVFLLVLYFFLPAWQLMSRRMIVFIALAAIAWLATVPFGRLASRAIRVAAFTLAALWAVDLTVQYAKWNPALEEAASLSGSIRPGSTLLYLPFAFPWQEDQIRFNPYRHFGNAVAAERNLVSFNNYEANEPYLPLQYKAGMNPYELIGCPEVQDPVNLEGYAKTGGTIDYVLLWVARPGNVSLLADALIRPQLNRGFDLIGTSSGRRAFLYRRKGFV